MENERRILALDLATKTGWAIRKNGKVHFGTAKFETGRFEGGGMRYLKFSRWLERIFFEGQPTEVHFEEVRRHVGTTAAHVYGGLLATLTAHCEKNKIPYKGVPVGAIKKHMTGKGNASKQAMIEAAKKLGHNVTDDNQADAIGILTLAESEAI